MFCFTPTGPFVREHFSESLVEANPATTEQTSNNSPHGDFTKDLSHRISKNLWPLVIGPRFAGKTTTISSAVKQLEPFSTSAASGTTSSLTSGPYTVLVLKYFNFTDFFFDNFHLLIRL